MSDKAKDLFSQAYDEAQRRTLDLFAFTEGAKFGAEIEREGIASRLGAAAEAAAAKAACSKENTYIKFADKLIELLEGER